MHIRYNYDAGCSSDQPAATGCERGELTWTLAAAHKLLSTKQPSTRCLPYRFRLASRATATAICCCGHNGETIATCPFPRPESSSRHTHRHSRADRGKLFQTLAQPLRHVPISGINSLTMPPQAMCALPILPSRVTLLLLPAFEPAPVLPIC